MPNARLLPDLAYVNGGVLQSSWWSGLDLAQFQSVNGDAGGTWAPSSAIELAGAGIWLCGPSTHVSASGISNGNTTQAVILHGDSDWIVTPSATITDRLIVTSVTQGRDASFGGVVGASSSGLNVPRFQYESTADGLINAASNTTYQGGGRIIVPLTVHHNATWLNVGLEFTVSAHSGVPANMPQLRVIQVDAFGNVTLVNVAYISTLANYAGNGFLQMPTASSGSAWHAGGAVQVLEYPIVDGFAPISTVIDTTQYCYFAEIVDEAGANSQSGNEYLSLLSLFTSPDMRPY